MLTWPQNRPQKAWLYVVLLVIIAFVVTLIILFANQFKKEPMKINGNYVFEKKIYLLLTPKLISDDYVEYYTFTDDTLTVTDAYGGKEEHTIAFQKSEVDKETFANEFSVLPGPDISGYQNCYLLTDDQGSYPYRVYAMDDELWLADFEILYITNTKGPTEKKVRIGNIFQIVPYDGEVPSKTNLSRPG